MKSGSHLPLNLNMSNFSFKKYKDFTFQLWWVKSFLNILINNRENQKLYGNVDYTLRENENVIDFLEQAIEVGLYFPVNVSDSRKEELNIALHRTLWWEYNQNRDKITNEKYNALCEKLIKMLISTKSIIREKELMLAELYRNIGNFEGSFKQLEELFVNPSIQVYVDCIKKQIEQKNNRTVIVEES